MNKVSNVKSVSAYPASVGEGLWQVFLNLEDGRELRFIITASNLVYVKHRMKSDTPKTFRVTRTSSMGLYVDQLV